MIQCLQVPELPEVETIRLGLQKYIVGKTIVGIEVRLKKMVTGDTKHVTGARIKDVKRFGKGLVIDLDNGYCLAIHIKLTGQLIYEGPDAKGIKQSVKVGGPLPNKFTHVIFTLYGTRDKKHGDAYLYYNDIRQFGWIRIVKASDLKTIPFFKDLGPEPLSNLTMKQFNNYIPGYITLNRFSSMPKISIASFFVASEIQKIISDSFLTHSSFLF